MSERDRAHMRWAHVEKSALATYFARGDTDRQIAELMGRSPAAIEKQREKQGLLRTRGRSKGGSSGDPAPVPIPKGPIGIVPKGKSLPLTDVYDHLRVIERHQLDQADSMASVVRLLTEIKILLQEGAKHG